MNCPLCSLPAGRVAKVCGHCGVELFDRKNGNFVRMMLGLIALMLFFYWIANTEAAPKCQYHEIEGLVCSK